MKLILSNLSMPLIILPTSVIYITLMYCNISNTPFLTQSCLPISVYPSPNYPSNTSFSLMNTNESYSWLLPAYKEPIPSPATHLFLVYGKRSESHKMLVFLILLVGAFSWPLTSLINLNGLTWYQRPVTDKCFLLISDFKNLHIKTKKIKSSTQFLFPQMLSDQLSFPAFCVFTTETKLEIEVENNVLEELIGSGNIRGGNWTDNEESSEEESWPKNVAVHYLHS